MKFQKKLLKVSIILVLAILTAACNKSSAPTDEAPPSAAPMATEVVGEETSEPGEAPTSEPNGIPEDVPIMPEAYDLQAPNQLNVSYKVNVPIQDVVTFYEENFEENGWTVMNNPDSVVGAMAQMSRSNPDGDRLIFSIQYNPVGEFTIVQIFITR